MEIRSIEKQDGEELPGFVLDPKENLWIAASRVGDDDLKVLKDRLIENLSLQSNKHITVEGMKTIVNLPIRRLILRETRLGNEIIPYVNKMKLQYLDLRGTRVNDAGVQLLCPSIRLTELSLADLKDVSNGCLPHVVNSFPNLFRLVVTNTKVTGKGLWLLKPLHKLTVLEASSLKLTDDDMDAIVMLHPTSITIESNLVTDKGLDKLLKLPVLAHLSILFCDRITTKKVAEFKNKYPNIHIENPNLKKEYIDSTLYLVPEPDQL